jgi:hypothetical protein
VGSPDPPVDRSKLIVYFGKSRIQEKKNGRERNKKGLFLTPNSPQSIPHI